MLNGLDLFSGIGGISLALKEWVRPIAYCEIDPYCQGVLLSRQMDGDLCAAPIWDDVKTLTSREFHCKIDIIYAGFPCQDISVAGSGRGLEGERSGLFYEICRLSNEIKPRWIFLENVPAITNRGGLEVVKEIAKMGYDCRWITITASSLGALHKRERWFLLAHFNSEPSRETNQISKSIEENEKTWLRSSGQNRGIISRYYWDDYKCPFFGMDDGIQFGLDRAKGLGNSVCPDQAKEAFKILMGLK